MSDVAYVVGLTAVIMGGAIATTGHISRALLFIACGIALAVWSYVRDATQ